MSIIKVYTDGSYKQGSNQGGFAVVREDEDGALTVLTKAPEKNTTSQRMELRAVYAAMRTVPRNGQLAIHCDCEAIVKRIREMQSNKYHEYKHQKDTDLWRDIEAEVTKWEGNLTIEWVKSMSHEGNLRAHREAKGEACR